jgi:hypothetical protein
MIAEKELAQILLCSSVELKIKIPLYKKQAYNFEVPENPLHNFSIVFCTIWKSMACVLVSGSATLINKI